MEAQQDGGAPAWLFSFVDLAFLMLIALTQLAGDVGADPPDLGEIVVPRIGEQATQGELRPDASRAWRDISVSNRYCLSLAMPATPAAA